MLIGFGSCLVDRAYWIWIVVIGPHPQPLPTLTLLAYTYPPPLNPSLSPPLLAYVYPSQPASQPAAGASILAPGGHRDLGSTLEDHGSSRMGTRRSRTRFLLIVASFWNNTMRVFWGLRLETAISVLSSPGHFLHRFPSRNIDAWGL